MLRKILSFALKNLDRFHRRYYTYIFVDQCVPPINQAVQAAHVAMVVGQNMHKNIDAEDVYFQICSLPTNMSALDMAYYLNKEGFENHVYYESDYDAVIAIGTHPVRSDKRRFLVNYNFLQF